MSAQRSAPLSVPRPNKLLDFWNTLFERGTALHRSRSVKPGGGLENFAISISVIPAGPLYFRHPRAGGDPPLPCPRWIPACAGMTEKGSVPSAPTSSPRRRGSTFTCPQWIPACAGMTEKGSVPSAPTSSPRRRGSTFTCPQWIPACAGMTEREACLTIRYSLFAIRCDR